MATVRTVKTSFVGGEISPELFGRVDFDKEQSGLALCSNFVVLPHGPVQNRAGTRFVAAVKNPSVATWLIAFSFSNTQTFAVELGVGYFRFHSLGAPLLLPGTGSNLLANPSFAVDLSGWGNNTAGTTSTVAWAAYLSGGSCVITKGTTGGPSIYQAVTTVPGKSYTLSFNFAITAGKHLQALVGSVLWGGDVLNQVGLVTGSYSFSFVATSTTSYVTLHMSDGVATDVATVYSVGVALQGISAYGAGTAYTPGDLCSSAGVNYYCVAATTGNAPPNATYWYALPASGVYEIPNPYAAGDLKDIHYVQSGDIVTLVHPSYPPMELRRYANQRWVLAAISFTSALIPPVTRNAVAVSNSTVSYAQAFTYQITALDAYGEEESLPCVATTGINNDLTLAGNWNTVTWTDPTQTGGVSAGYFNVYKSVNGGAFGYAGQVKAGVGSFRDNNITPDYTQTPPTFANIMNGANNYPAAVGYYEQRRVFGGFNAWPETFYASQPGAQSNFNYSLPSQASDRLYVTIAAQRANYIRHIVAILDLLVLTASTEWRVYTAAGDALTPSNITIKAQQQNGASNVQPVVVNNLAAYAASQGGHIRALSYEWTLSGYKSEDLCLLARHLFDYHTIVDMAFSRSPYPIIWAVNEAGVLLGCTFLPDQQVQAWHQHTTNNGWFESICTVTEGNFDVLYAVVRRTINGTTTRYVECLDTRAYNGVLANAFFVDCGVTAGPATSSLSGLTWLANMTVSALLDGKPVTGLTVSAGGVLTLPYAATVIQVGLPITAAMETAPLALAGDASFGKGRVKNINKVWGRVTDFCGCFAGPAASVGDPSPAGVDWQAAFSYAGDGVTPVMANGEFQLSIMPSWNQDGCVLLEQSLPVPLTVVDLTFEVAVGG